MRKSVASVLALVVSALAAHAHSAPRPRTDLQPKPQAEATDPIVGRRFPRAFEPRSVSVVERNLLLTKPLAPGEIGIPSVDRTLQSILKQRYDAKHDGCAVAICLGKPGSEDFADLHYGRIHDAERVKKWEADMNDDGSTKPTPTPTPEPSPRPAEPK